MAFVTSSVRCQGCDRKAQPEPHGSGLRITPSLCTAKCVQSFQGEVSSCLFFVHDSANFMRYISKHLEAICVCVYKKREISCRERNTFLCNEAFMCFPSELSLRCAHLFHQAHLSVNSSVLLDVDN